MLNLLRNSINVLRKVSGLDSDASAFITAAGLTDATQKDAINTLVKDMKAAGLWSKMKAVYPMVGGTATSMKFNLKDPRDLDAAFRLTWSGGWTYSATGATGNGTNAYADTKLDPTVALASNSVHISYYQRNEANGYQIGCTQSDYSKRFALSPIGTNDYVQIGAGATSVAKTTTIANYIGTRNGSVVKLYKNNSTIITASDSGVLPSINVFLNTNNQSSTTNNYSAANCGFATIGTGLSDQDASLLNQIVEKYQVALSRGVQAAQSFYYNSAYSNEANTYLYSTQITGTTQVSAINTLINGLKANNLWTKMKAVYPFVTDNYNFLSYTTTWASPWTGGGVGTTGQADPFGGTTATLGNGGEIFQPYTYTNGSQYTLSVYAKAAGVSIFTFGTDVAANTYCTFNLSTQSVTNSAGYVGTITSVGSGWYRCSITFSYNVGGTFAPYYDLKPTGGTMYFAAPQLQLGTLSNYQAIVGTQQSTISAQMKFNLVNPQDSDAAFRLAFSGGWTYSTNGAQPNGTNGYADTKLVPSANYANYNSHLSLYSRTDANGGFDMGSETNTFELLIRYSGTFYSRFSGDATYSNPNSLGYYIANTISGIIKGFKNGANVSNTTNANQVVNSYNVYIGAVNSLGSASLYSNRQYSFATIGTGLTDAEAALLYSLVQQYQTDLSRQV